MEKAILEEWGVRGNRRSSFRGWKRRRGFVVINVLGEEAEIDETKVGSQVSLERELVSEDTTKEIGHVA
jgi:hypothetical protein